MILKLLKNKNIFLIYIFKLYLLKILIFHFVHLQYMLSSITFLIVLPTIFTVYIKHIKK